MVLVCWSVCSWRTAGVEAEEHSVCPDWSLATSTCTHWPEGSSWVHFWWLKHVNLRWLVTFGGWTVRCVPIETAVLLLILAAASWSAPAALHLGQGEAEESCCSSPWPSQSCPPSRSPSSHPLLSVSLPWSWTSARGLSTKAHSHCCVIECFPSIESSCK